MAKFLMLFCVYIASFCGACLAGVRAVVGTAAGAAVGVERVLGVSTPRFKDYLLTYRCAHVSFAPSDFSNAKSLTVN